jgi:hypothetical protein
MIAGRLFLVADALDVEARWLATGKGERRRNKDPVKAVPDELLRLARHLTSLPKSEQTVLLKIFERRASDERVEASLPPAPKKPT